MGDLMKRLIALALAGLMVGFGDVSAAFAQTPTSAAQDTTTQAPQPAEQPAPTQNSSAPAAGQGTAVQEPPDAPSAVQSQTSNPQTSSPQSVSPPPASPQTATPTQTSQQQTSQQQQNTAQTPSGTAAATIGNAKGTLGSRPAGSAIAPKEQRRSRSLLIKLGLLAGAGVALGSVMALSHASPARPPGAP